MRLGRTHVRLSGKRGAQSSTSSREGHNLMPESRETREMLLEKSGKQTSPVDESSYSILFLTCKMRFEERREALRPPPLPPPQTLRSLGMPATCLALEREGSYDSGTWQGSRQVGGGGFLLFLFFFLDAEENHTFPFSVVRRRYKVLLVSLPTSLPPLTQHKSNFFFSLNRCLIQISRARAFEAFTGDTESDRYTSVSQVSSIPRLLNLFSSQYFPLSFSDFFNSSFKGESANPYLAGRVFFSLLKEGFL